MGGGGVSHRGRCDLYTMMDGSRYVPPALSWRAVPSAQLRAAGNSSCYCFCWYILLDVHYKPSSLKTQFSTGSLGITYYMTHAVSLIIPVLFCCHLYTQIFYLPHTEKKTQRKGGKTAVLSLSCWLFSKPTFCFAMKLWRNLYYLYTQKVCFLYTVHWNFFSLKIHISLILVDY